MSEPEQRTERFRSLRGVGRWVGDGFLFLAVAVGLLWAADLPILFRLTIFTEQFLSVFWTLILSAVFVVVPAYRGERRSDVPWYDWAGVALALVVGGYVTFNYERLLYESALVTVDKWSAGLASLLLLLEATRRLAGRALLIILVVFLAYCLFANWVPEPLKGPNVRWERLAIYMLIDTNALLGLPMAVGAKIVLVFVVLGNLMFASGGGRFFTDLAVAAMGAYRGGPAKVSVMASSLFGSISGTAVSNVVTTGMVTIPLMKKHHYKAETAAAIEAVASTGGQIMPPVLGATSFLMAEFLQLPFRVVVLASVVPALLYYFLVFLQIDLEAGKFRMAGLDRAELPRVRSVMRNGWLFIAPLAVLVYTLFWLHYSAGKAGLSAVAAVFLVSLLRRETRFSARGLLEVCLSSGRGVLEIGVIVGIAGVIIGVLNLSTLGFNLSVLMIKTGGQSQVALLLMATVLAVVLGMGMPTISVYLLLAVLIGPALIEVGFNPLAAHMFLLYTGMLSMLSPPVAIASFTAASVANADPMRTAWISLRLGAMAFVAPFVFIFSPELLLVGETLAIVERIVTVFCGTAFFAVAVIGYLRQAVPILWRVLLALCSIATFFPAALGGAAAPWISLPAAALGGTLLAVLWAHGRRPGQAVEPEGPAGG